MSFRGGTLHELLKSPTWESGFVAGAIAMLAAVCIGGIIRRVFARWKLLGADAWQKKLQLPAWSRWLLASADSLAIACYGFFATTMIIDVERQHFLVCVVGCLAAGSFALLGLVYAGWHGDAAGRGAPKSPNGPRAAMPAS